MKAIYKSTQLVSLSSNWAGIVRQLRHYRFHSNSSQFVINKSLYSSTLHSPKYCQRYKIREMQNPYRKKCRIVPSSFE
jgi:hypothetical protein